MVKEFEAQLNKGDNPGAWTCVVLDDVKELFGTRGLVKIRGAIDGEPFDGALMAQGDGTHRLPVRATLRKAIGKEAGDTVHVRIDERIGEAAARAALRRGRGDDGLGFREEPEEALQGLPVALDPEIARLHGVFQV